MAIGYTTGTSAFICNVSFLYLLAPVGYTKTCIVFLRVAKLPFKKTINFMLRFSSPLCNKLWLFIFLNTPLVYHSKLWYLCITYLWQQSCHFYFCNFLNNITTCKFPTVSLVNKKFASRPKGGSTVEWKLRLLSGMVFWSLSAYELKYISMLFLP